MSREKTKAGLQRLLYTSRCAIDGDFLVRTAKVRELAARSVPRNRLAGLTGCLLFVENSFVQVLEGPSPQVEATFERICSDFRHSDVKLIDLASATDRLFADWSMAFLGDADETSVATRGDLQEISFLAGINAREAVRLMNEVLDRATARVEAVG